MNATDLAASNSGAGSMAPRRRPLSNFRRVVGWFALLLILLVTTLLLGWIILGFVLLGSGPSQDAQPVSGIFLLLLIFCGISAWLTARYIASWRSVWTMIFVILAVVAFLGGDWMMSAPLQALYLARDIAWDGTGIGDYRKYPQRTINNAPPVFQFRQNLLPNHFRGIEFLKWTLCCGPLGPVS